MTLTEAERQARLCKRAGCDCTEGKAMPTTDETIEWVEQMHYAMSDIEVVDYCGRCGSDWPCVPVRLVEEVKILRAALEGK